MDARAEMCGVSLVEDAFVFSNSPDGSAPWFPDSVSRSFKRLCVLEGLYKVDEGATDPLGEMGAMLMASFEA
jgi:hypothetical protein